MKKHTQRTICFIRSTSIINDSRASKEITSLMNGGFNVIVLGWDRDSKIPDYNDVRIGDKKINAVFCRTKSKYGKSFSTIKGLLLFQTWLKKQLKKIIKEIDYIHACDFDCGYMAYKISKKYKKKLIYDMYDYYTDSRPMPKIIASKVENKENNIINNADIAIICGEWRKDQIVNTKPKKLIVIHNTPDLKFMNHKSIIKSKTKKLKVAYVGVFQNDRLLLELLEEFKKHDEYELHIGGFGIYENQIKTASEKNNNIFYYGSLKYDDVLALESDCDILFATYNPIVKNHKYSAPNKVYEAMALGKPIIVCKNTGLDKLVTNNNIGVAIGYDANEFFEVLNDHNNKKKDSMSNPIYLKKLYKERYSWEIMEKILIDSYNELSKGR